MNDETAAAQAAALQLPTRERAAASAPAATMLSWLTPNSCFV